MKAGILLQVNTPLVIEDVDLSEPAASEVLVKISAVGVCHTDLSVVHGKTRQPLPMVLGHEGAGVVERVGSEVTTVKPGDHVVLSPLAYCRECAPCKKGKPYLCKVAVANVSRGSLLDGTKRLRRKNGQQVSHLYGQASFAEYAVVPEVCAVKIRHDVPLEKAALFGCGAATGIGAVLNAAQVESGDRVAVFGCGGVGLSAIMAARVAGAAQIIAVDTLDHKLQLAQELGATHTINVSHQNPVHEIHRLTGGGVDHALECTGNPKVMEQAFQAAAVGGKTVIAGVAPMGATINLAAMSFLFNKSVQGVSLGNIRPEIDIPKFVDLFANGQLPIDRMISRTYSLEQVNEALAAIDGGEVVRSVVVFS